MSEMEQKRQIVQDGLNKRKTKRKQAVVEAEQEALTMQMIDIVNRNARNAEIKKRAERAERKERLRIDKITMASKNGNKNIATNLFVAAIILFVAIALYVVHLTELWLLIAVSVLFVAYVAFNIYSLIINIKKLAKLKERKCTK